MSLRLLRWLLIIVVLSFVGTAKADTLGTVWVDGSHAFASPPYGIPPYGGTLNRQSESFYCVDFSAPISAGDSWNVDIANLVASNFVSTRLGSQTPYLDMAWLITQIVGTTDQGLKAEYQFAIWSFTGGPNQQTTSALMKADLDAVTSGKFTGQGFYVLTPRGSKGQEFLIHVPEPPVLLMLGIAFVIILSCKRPVA
jgi:hypothetical protein